MSRPLIIWGASDHAEVVAEASDELGIHDIVGFLDDTNSEKKAKGFCGKHVFRSLAEIVALMNESAIRYIFGFGACLPKLRLAERAGAMGLVPESIVHPRSRLSTSAVIEAGTFVAMGAVVGTKSRIGKHAIINTSASVDHHCIVEDTAHICPGANLAGNVVVKTGAWVGIGATVIEKVTIGEYAKIGAGSVVIDDIPPGMVAYGVPARIKRPIKLESSEDGQGD